MERLLLEGQTGLCQHPVDICILDGMLFQQALKGRAIQQDNAR